MDETGQSTVPSGLCWQQRCCLLYGEQSAIKETPFMLLIVNAYAVSGFYVGHAVYVSVEVVIP